MSKFQVNGGELYYSLYVESNTHPIIFIHGLALDSRVWKPQIDLLSKKYKVITYDLRGFGKSSIPRGEYDHVMDLHSLLTHLKVEKATIVGHSHGGAVATNYALEHKEMVESLILLSPSLQGYKVYNPFWEQLQELGRKGDKERIKKKMLEHDMFERFPQDSEEYSFLKRFVSDYSCWHFLNKDLAKKYNTYERLEELRGTPIKVVYGQYEENNVKEVANIFRDRARAEVIEIEEVGHMTNLEKPEVINDLIKN